MSGELRGIPSTPTEWKPSGEKPRGQWKSTNQKRDSSSLVNGPDFMRSHGSSMCSGFHPDTKSRNRSTGTISAIGHDPQCRPRTKTPGLYRVTSPRAVRSTGAAPNSQGEADLS